MTPSLKAKIEAAHATCPDNDHDVPLRPAGQRMSVCSACYSTERHDPTCSDPIHKAIDAALRAACEEQRDQDVRQFEKLVESKDAERLPLVLDDEAGR